MFGATLLILNVAAAESKSGVASRVLETLIGPPHKGPRPPTKAALLHCNSPGWENADKELLKSAGIPEMVVLSVHHDQKTWPTVVKQLYASYPDHLVSIVLDLSCPAANETLLTVSL